MNNQEINQLLDRMRQLTADMELLYVENGGEVTEEVLAMENEIAGISQTLLSEGVDSLGRWMKGKEDELASVKAERDYCDRRRKSVENTLAYIKAKIADIMAETGQSKVKGDLGYSFTAYDSVKTTVDASKLNDEWGAVAEKALRDAGLPAWITVKLSASATAVPEGEELPDVFDRTVTPSVKFSKPRASKVVEG